MGWITHNAIVVTSALDKKINAAARAARTIGLQVVGPSKGATNGYRSILVCPDGSKSGWAESQAGDDRREKFIAWLTTNVYEDGSSAFEWVEIQYGDDDGTATIPRSKWSPASEGGGE